MSSLPYDQRRQPDDWFAAQPPPTVSGIMAPRQTAQDQQLLQDPAFRQRYHAWVDAQGPGAADWATPTGYLEQTGGAPAPTNYDDPTNAANKNQKGAPTGIWENPGNPTQGPSSPTGGPSTGGARTPFAGGEAEFTALFGRPGTPAELVALEDRMKAYGITIARNAAGTAGKIRLPNGQIIDVIRGAEGGGQGFWWGEGGPAAGGMGAGGGMNGYDPGYADRLGYTGDLQMDPGFQFRLQQGQQAIERSAAAKGTLLTGGTLKGLERYAQDYSSNEFQNRYQRLFGEQQNRYNQLYGLASLGQNAAAQTGNANQNFANQGGNLLTDQGNAQAAGTVGAANAKNAAIQNSVNLAQQLYLARLYGQQRVPTTDPYAPGGSQFSGPYNQ